MCFNAIFFPSSHAVSSTMILFVVAIKNYADLRSFVEEEQEKKQNCSINGTGKRAANEEK
jgi:hypothetical protein